MHTPPPARHPLPKACMGWGELLSMARSPHVANHARTEVVS